MGTDRACVYIPVDEYRELVQAKRDADCLKAILTAKVKEEYCCLDRNEIAMLYAMFAQQTDESW